MSEEVKLHKMKFKRFTLVLTKTELNKLYALVNEHKKREVPIHIRHQLTELYHMANNIPINGGGA
jgi:ABC-type sugar transport system ATPase subunit